MLLDDDYEADEEEEAKTEHGSYDGDRKRAASSLDKELEPPPKKQKTDCENINSVPTKPKDETTYTPTATSTILKFLDALHATGAKP